MLDEPTAALTALRVAETFTSGFHYPATSRSDTRVATATRITVRGGEREQFADKVYSMVEKTYRSIGIPANNPRQLLKYPLWWVYLGRNGDPVAFNLFKETKFGKKSGLAGSDMTSEGKSTIVGLIRNKFKENGIYGEVSHAVEGIALSAGAPIVPAKYVSQILGKPIEILEDGEHYLRSITNVGKVKKIMLGKPRGLSGLKESGLRQPEARFDDPADIDAHIHCLLCS